MHPLLLQRVPGQQLYQRHCLSCPTARVPLNSARTSTVVYAKPTRAADFRDLSDEEIDQQVEASKLEMFKLRFQAARKEAFKPSDKHWHKKKIAQLLTVKREREIKQGVSSRESRRIQKKKNIEAGFPQF